MIVQAIVEAVTRKPYRNVANDLLWSPFGLDHCGIFSGLNPPDALAATNYKSADRSEPPFVYGVPAFMGMIGGFYMDAAGMFRVIDIVRKDRLLSSKGRETLLRPRFHGPGGEEGYALGGRTRAVLIAGGQKTYMAESGNNLGFRALAYGLTDSPETVVMLNNVSIDRDDMEPTAFRLLEAMVRGRMPVRVVVKQARGTGDL
ncbi:serine hydrolase [Asticcacaulis sp. 201]|uniref:serine hydrolase n=1 Tax=Asticcacaulis sp. 201 TaxID=3028787 RepID=UPI0029163780|nr:serine hydrolase [Asticcacaulis sp. 201]MDV6331221.1 serine hydrolase [Asticcacaulis sp. 201]